MITVLDDRKRRQENYFNPQSTEHIQVLESKEILEFQSLLKDPKPFKLKSLIIGTWKTKILCVHATSLFLDAETTIERFEQLCRPLDVCLIKFSGGYGLSSTIHSGQLYSMNVKTFYNRLFHPDNSVSHNDPDLFIFGVKQELNDLLRFRRWYNSYFKENDLMDDPTIDRLKNKSPVQKALKSIIDNLDSNQRENYTKSYFDGFVSGEIQKIVYRLP